MFITNRALKSPISHLFLGEPGDQFWLATELAFFIPWFLVTIRQAEPAYDDDAVSVGRAMLLTEFADVERLVQECSGGPNRIESTLVVTPGHLNGTGEWKMEPLEAVWTAEDSSAPGRKMTIFETQAGVKYSDTSLSVPVGELQNQTLRFRLSATAKV